MFDVRTLCPGETEAQVAERLAEYFNRISGVSALEKPNRIPTTYAKNLPLLEPFQAAGRIKHFEKPRLMVKGDVFPCLMMLYEDQFAVPLLDIYNETTVTSVWPCIWKHESVTVIPKTSHPNDFGDLRNISCTMLASKIYESYVLG